MLQVILPTSELLRDHQELEQMFAFYPGDENEPGGLRALIRDMVLVAADENQEQLKKAVHGAFRQAIQSNPLIEKVMRDYAMSDDARIMFHMGSGTSHESSVEINAELLYQRVLDMMSRIFMRAVYEVSKQEWQWVGDDLVATVNVLDAGK